MKDEHFVDENGHIVCVLDGSRFVGMRDFKAHCGSSRHRKRVGVEKVKPKRRKVNAREKIFNY